MKYQYMSYNSLGESEKSFIDKLNELGNDGWRVVTIACQDSENPIAIAFLEKQIS